MGCPQWLQQLQGLVSCRIQSLPCSWGLHTCWRWNEQHLKPQRPSLYSRTSLWAMWLFRSPLGIGNFSGALRFCSTHSLLVVLMGWVSTTPTPSLPANSTYPFSRVSWIILFKFFIAAEHLVLFSPLFHIRRALLFPCWHFPVAVAPCPMEKCEERGWVSLCVVPHRGSE